MMRIVDSQVLKTPKKNIIENVKKSKRWKDEIEIENNMFVLNSFKDVETLIDLLDERYTVSEITGAEYDTEVKEIVKNDKE